MTLLHVSAGCTVQPVRPVRPAGEATRNRVWVCARPGEGARV